MREWVAISTEAFGLLCYFCGFFTTFGIIGLMKVISNCVHKCFQPCKDEAEKV